MGEGIGCAGDGTPSMSRLRLRDLVAADGPDYVNLRKAGRAALVAPAVLAIGEFVLHKDAVAIYAVFASVVGLVFADYGGPSRRRAFGYLTMIVAGAAVIAVGAVLSASVVASVAGMFVVAFVVTFGTAFGGYAPLHVAAVALAFSLSVLEPLADLSLPQRLLGWAFGGTAALVAALVLWPIDRRSGLHDASARATGHLANALAARDRPAEAAAHVKSAAAAVTELNARLATPLRPYGPAVRDIATVHMIEHLEHCVVLVGDVLDAPPPAGGAEVDRLLRAAVTALERSRHMLVGEHEATAATTDVVALDHAMAGASERVRIAAASEGSDDGTRALHMMMAAIPLLALSHVVVWIELDAARATAPGGTVAPSLATAPEVARRARRSSGRPSTGAGGSPGGSWTLMG